MLTRRVLFSLLILILLNAQLALNCLSLTSTSQHHDNDANESVVSSFSGSDDSLHVDKNQHKATNDGMIESEEDDDDILDDITEISELSEADRVKLVQQKKEISQSESLDRNVTEAKNIEQPQDLKVRKMHLL